MFRAVSFLLLIFVQISCGNQDYSPKPRGYHRIILPEKQFSQASPTGCPYSFEIPQYSKLVKDEESNAQPCWKNLDFPNFNAKLHLSYFEINKNATLNALTEDARAFVFKHSPKATAIDQQKITQPQQDVYGLSYTIQGNTASNFQFYVTDNKKHYLRGALYFYEKPNMDSIQPVLEFVKSDIQHLITTIRWK